MAFAYFMGHMFKADPPVLIPLLNGGNAAILFCFSCLYLACAGGGVWSVDAMMRKRVDRVSRTRCGILHAAPQSRDRTKRRCS